MSSIWLILIASCVFLLAYRFYASFIAAKVLVLNDANITPAYRFTDGREYVPTNKWVLFGHHFAAIAGPGPLIGPVLATQYGWGPGFFWILLGSVFAGTVHDFIILFASVRHDGQSLAVIARKEVGPIAGITTSLAIIFIIIVALAGLGIVVANALFNNPWGVYTIFMTIPIAIIIGLYMFKIVPGSIRSGSIVGMILVLLAVFTGRYVQDASFAHVFTLTKDELALALPIYGFIAAVLPVWLLLAPRDYLSSYMKIGTVVALALGILIVRPDISMPFTTAFTSGGGPIIPGPVWPYVCITIACGAISGFHSLISSGTTPKMVELESQMPMIGYGSMLVEGFVGVIALISAVSLLPGDYFAINTSAATYAKISAEFPTVDLQQLSTLVGMDVAHRPGGAVSLAVGMAHIFSSIGGMKHLMNFWYQFAIMFEALFILTTIDAGTRVARYILQDVIGSYIYPPIKRTSWWPGILFTSALVSAAWGYLLYSGEVATIWPIFGVANQLLGCIALAIGVTIILKISKKHVHALICLVPLTFLAVTVLTAGYMNIFDIYLKLHTTLGIVNTCISAFLMLLVVVILVDSWNTWMKLLKLKTPMGLNTGTPAIAPVGEAKPSIS